MITYVVSDIFHSPAKTLVNTVNTKGVMGKGLAKDFKTIYPKMFQEYRDLCDKRKLNIGQLFLFRTPNKWVLNFPTKQDWKRPSKPEYIEAGLKTFVNGYSRANITSVAFPQLGCGHGELDWTTQVQPLMENYLSKIPIIVFIHLYPFTPTKYWAFLNIYLTSEKFESLKAAHPLRVNSQCHCN